MGVLRFLASVLGKTVQAPGGIGGECVDLANLYIAQVFDLPHVYANAVDWRSAQLPGFMWEDNAPYNYPPVGSLVVWGQSIGAGTGPDGHIAIALVADAGHVVSADQNWSKRHVTLELHPYTGVLGWWQPA